MVVSLANIMGSTLLKSIDLKIFHPGNGTSKWGHGAFHVEVIYCITFQETNIAKTC